eukprot:TRINITY_DN23174_c0_g3_i1.p1 TRINITY_DN23174_c0_g3~~TRINITY_DN23174_c0_g3_i1.p1  ORF type:complete len:1119 (+),score=239.81 TRINITY_DN23174_c0_g3_i1:469-3357(+)
MDCACENVDPLHQHLNDYGYAGVPDTDEDDHSEAGRSEGADYSDEGSEVNTDGEHDGASVAVPEDRHQETEPEDSQESQDETEPDVELEEPGAETQKESSEEAQNVEEEYEKDQEIVDQPPAIVKEQDHEEDRMIFEDQEAQDDNDENLQGIEENKEDDANEEVDLEQHTRVEEAAIATIEQERQEVEDIQHSESDDSETDTMGSSESDADPYSISSAPLIEAADVAQWESTRFKSASASPPLVIPLVGVAAGAALLSALIAAIFGTAVTSGATTLGALTFEGGRGMEGNDTSAALQAILSGMEHRPRWHGTEWRHSAAEADTWQASVTLPKRLASTSTLPAAFVRASPLLVGRQPQAVARRALALTPAGSTDLVPYHRSSRSSGFSAELLRRRAAAASGSAAARATAATLPSAPASLAKSGALRQSRATLRSWSAVPAAMADVTPTPQPQSLTLRLAARSSGSAAVEVTASPDVFSGLRNLPLEKRVRLLRVATAALEEVLLEAAADAKPRLPTSPARALEPSPLHLRTPMHFLQLPAPNEASPLTRSELERRVLMSSEANAWARMLRRMFQPTAQSFKRAPSNLTLASQAVRRRILELLPPAVASAARSFAVGGMVNFSAVASVATKRHRSAAQLRSYRRSGFFNAFLLNTSKAVAGLLPGKSFSTALTVLPMYSTGLTNLTFFKASLRSTTGASSQAALMPLLPSLGFAKNSAFGKANRRGSSTALALRPSIRLRWSNWSRALAEASTWGKLVLAPVTSKANVASMLRKTLTAALVPAQLRSPSALKAFAAVPPRNYSTALTVPARGNTRTNRSSIVKAVAARALPRRGSASLSRALTRAPSRALVVFASKRGRKARKAEVTARALPRRQYSTALVPAPRKAGLGLLRRAAPAKPLAPLLGRVYPVRPRHVVSTALIVVPSKKKAKTNWLKMKVRGNRATSNCTTLGFLKPMLSVWSKA